jgi:hypothetical protein
MSILITIIVENDDDADQIEQLIEEADFDAKLDFPFTFHRTTVTGDE